jgi:ribosomal protein L40E
MNKKRYRNKLRPSGLTNSKVYGIKKRYRLTEVEYLQLVESQNNQCKICRSVLTKEVIVDHNHITGKIRGLLCRKCNFALGLFKDDPAILQRAHDYLL